jgi:transposase
LVTPARARQLERVLNHQTLCPPRPPEPSARHARRYRTAETRPRHPQGEQIPAFIELAAKITRHRVRILAAIEHNLSNALIESTNTKVRLITRKAYGFKSPDALIALAMLTLGPQQPTLPGRK